MAAWDMQIEVGRGMMTKIDLDRVSVKEEINSIRRLESIGTKRELGEVWNVKDELMEKHCIKVNEIRGINTSNKVIQVLADAFEVKIGESGEDNSCARKQTSV